MSSRALPDEEARHRAATDFDHNLVVVAGAGTGKTSLLVQRALVAVGSGLVEIGQLAAITFTEKAAGEMRRRLTEGLGRLRSLATGEETRTKNHVADRTLTYLLGDHTREEIATRTLAALQRLDRARIATIHTFCAEVLREHPVEARVQPDFVVDEGEHAARLFEQHWGEFLRAEMAEDAPRGELWRRLLEKLPLDLVREFARSVSGFRLAPGLVASAATVRDPREILGERVQWLLSELESILAEQEGLTPLPKAHMEDCCAALRAFQDGGLEAIHRERAARAHLRRKSAPKVSDALRNVDLGHARSLAREADGLIKGLDVLDEELFPRMVEAVLPFAQSFREMILRWGFVTFDGLLVLARDLLRDHPGVRERLKSRYRFLLLDEFQDTDPMQYEIVLFLAESKGGEAIDPYAAELEAGRLFVVGDPKQSIYRFRGADYSAFVRAVDRIAPDPANRLHLTANFRSLGGVLAPINLLFGFPEDGGEWNPSEYQPDYEAIDAVREGDDGVVELWSIDVEGPAESRRRTEGQAIATKIAAMKEHGEYDYGEVSIILRAFTNLPLYLRPLRKLGIPFVVDGGKELLDRTEVMQFLSALRALARPADPVALLAFLRSPAAGVPDRELAAFASREEARRDDWDWRRRVDPAQYPAMARAFGLLQELEEETADLPADGVVRHVLRRTHLLPLGAYGYEGAQRVANVRKIAGAAGELARAGRLTLNEILDALEKERYADREGESPLADETWQAVRILTAHSSKGLENKVVFVPDLARGAVQEAMFETKVEADAVPLDAGAEGLGIKIDKVKNVERFRFEEERKKHSKAEEVRTLYVALTRARDRLYLLGGRYRGQAPPWLAPLAAWGYRPKEELPADGEVLESGVVHRIVGAVAAVEQVQGELLEDCSGAVERFCRAVENLGALAKPPFRHPAGLHEEETERRDAAASGIVAARMARGRGRAKAVGKAAHTLLELWDRDKDASLTAPLKEVARAAAAGEEVKPEEIEAEVRDLMKTFLASPLALRLRQVKVLGREIPMLWRDDESATWRGSIDLLYEWEGEVHVADFKTDPDETEAVARHAGQLDIYRRAVRRALDLPELPPAELWMLRHGKILQVTGEPAGGSPPEPGDDGPSESDSQLSLFG